jgi:hypothetical protein
MPLVPAATYPIPTIDYPITRLPDYPIQGSPCLS